MNSWQSEALEVAQQIRDADLRTRTIMLVLADNIDGLRALRRKPLLQRDSSSVSDYYTLIAALARLSRGHP